MNLPIDSPEYQETCQSGEDNRNSDLCAQWKAADAARDAADHARTQLWIALGGIGGLIVTLILTLQAVKAARASVAVAQDVAKRQLRAYVTLSNMAHFYHDTKEPIVNVRYRNTGQSPAINAHAVMTISARLLDDLPRVPHIRAVRAQRHMIGPDCEQMIEARYAKVLKRGQLEKLRKGKLRLYLAGSIIYTDIFGRRWLHRFMLRSHLPFRAGTLQNIFAHEREVKPRRQRKQRLWEKAKHRLSRLRRR